MRKRFAASCAGRSKQSSALAALNAALLQRYRFRSAFKLLLQRFQTDVPENHRGSAALRHRPAALPQRSRQPCRAVAQRRAFAFAARAQLFFCVVVVVLLHTAARVRTKVAKCSSLQHDRNHRTDVDARNAQNREAHSARLRAVVTKLDKLIDELRWSSGLEALSGTV